MNNGLQLRHPQIMSRVLNRPLLLEGGYSRVFVQAIADSSDISVNFVGDTSAMMPIETPERAQKSYNVIDGVAILPVSGTLVHKYGHVQPYSGMTGYDGIMTRIAAAAEDGRVHTIMLDIDSPGGEVSGCQELADYIAGVEKPVVAYVDELACSAAYWIASACDYIAGPKTGGVGSIGVVWMHADLSEQIKNAGINITFIHAGAHKVDGNPYEPLGEATAAEFQAETDNIYGMFVASVESGRTNMTAASIRATEARVYMGNEALEAGLIDQVISKGDFVAALASSPGNPSGIQAVSAATSPRAFTLDSGIGNFNKTNLRGSQMVDQPDAVAGFTAEQMEAAKVEAAQEARDAAIKEYEAAAAVKAERAAAINAHAKGSAKIKTHLAGDAFASVPLEALNALMDDTEKGFSAIMDEEGGTGLEALPREISEADPESADARAARIAKAAEAMKTVKSAL